MIYKANDKFNATLSTGYTIGQSTLYVSSVPDNVPTIIVAAKGTSNETVFEVTGKTVNSLTGVTRLRGANVNLDAQTPITCLNNEEFVNQYSTALFSAEGLKNVLAGTDGGSTDAYEITLDPAPTAYNNLIGVPIVFKANTANTGACSLNINSLGVKTIKKNYNSDLATGDILANQYVLVVYDGTNFQMQSNTETPVTYLAPTQLTDGATIAIDHLLNTKFYVTLGGNRALSLTNLVVGKPLLLDLIQDSTGSRLITWPEVATDTITMTIAAPGVVTTTKDLPTCTPVIFSTTGALPTGITAGTRYYWVRQSATTGNLATSVVNAQAGTVITTSGSQSGVHTMKVQIRWGATDTIPTLTTGKHRIDTFGLMPRDVTNGVMVGYTVGTDA